MDGLRPSEIGTLFYSDCVIKNKAYLYSDLTIRNFIERNMLGEFFFLANQEKAARKLTAILINHYKTRDELKEPIVGSIGNATADWEPYYVDMPDPEALSDFLEWFENLHSGMDRRPGPLGFYTLSVDAFREDQWFLHFSDRCRKAGVVVEGWKDLKDDYELHGAER